MAEFFHRLFSSSEFMPHGHCYFWRPGVLWLHSLSDGMIALAYFSIPITLIYFIRKRRDLPFNGIFWCFATFILACGTTHLIEIYVIWHPVYWFQGMVKAFTAGISLVTAVMLVKLVPRAMELPSPTAMQREINERRRAEERAEENVVALKRSNLELEQFAYVASHDLREPLRAVSGCAQILKNNCRGKLDAEADAMIGHVVEGAKRMGDIIDDLLALSRIGSHGNPFEPMEIEKPLKRALENLSVSIRERGAVVRHEALPVLPVDGSRLTLLFQNLIANAIKFCKERTPEIHIGAAREPEGFWVISVRDNGIGIEPKYFERIFGVFQRLHTRDEYPGTGIGLAICKKIVERHGGRIWPESAPGVGTIFRFTLPEEQRNDGE